MRKRELITLCAALVILGVFGQWIFRAFFADELRIGGLAPTTVPAALIPAFDHEDNDLFWFGLRVEEGDDKSYRARLELDAEPVSAARLAHRPEQITLPEDRRTVRVPLTFELPPQETFWWVWKVDGEQIPVQEGVHQIKILPDSMIAWDLEDATGRRIRPELMVACLSAWTIADFRRPSPIATLTTELSNAIGRDAEDIQPGGPMVSAFVAASAARLFETNRFRLSLREDPLPLRGRYPIRRPDHLLGLEQRASIGPVEAALLLGALTRQFSRWAEVRVFILPAGSEKDSRRTVYFSWLDGTDWLSISTEPGKLNDFLANQVSSTALVNRVLEARPEVDRRLEEEGVYLSGGEQPDLIALDIHTAQDVFRVGTIQPEGSAPAVVAASRPTGGYDGYASTSW